jgi:aryl-alcohol dehydrogenase-like predicted oxidoreductase
LGDLGDHFKENEAFGVWREGYHGSLNAYIQASLAKLEERDAQVLKPVFDKAWEPLAPPIPGASWAQQAWWYCASRPGVSSVLAGIRQPAYVDEAHCLADLIIG